MNYTLLLAKNKKVERTCGLDMNTSEINSKDSNVTESKNRDLSTKLKSLAITEDDSDSDSDDLL